MRHGDRGDLLPVDATNRLLYYSSREEWVANDIRDGLNYGWLPGWTLHDPVTGKVEVAIYSGNDYDGGTAGNFDPRYESVEVYTARGNAYNASTLQPLPYALNTNAHAFWWDGDLNHELIDTTVVRKFNPATNSLVAIFSPSGVSSGAGKNMPQLQADLFGDWREEYIARVGSTALRVFTTIAPTNYGIRTLMHDPQYRMGVALQNSTYNMSPHASFFLGPNSPLPAKRTDIQITLAGTVVEVVQPEPITVVYGTDWAALNLPEQVQVKVDTGAYRVLAVEWDSTDYDPLSATAQTIKGTLVLTDRIINPDELMAEIQVNVIYDWSGFFPPVDNLPTLNKAKAGSAIPVKFSLNGDRGLNIFAEGYPQSRQIICDSGAALNDVDETVSAGGSSLSYDASEDQYVYVWKTDNAWAGTCWQLVVMLNDGTTHLANFGFK